MVDDCIALLKCSFTMATALHGGLGRRPLSALLLTVWYSARPSLLYGGVVPRKKFYCNPLLKGVSFTLLVLWPPAGCSLELQYAVHAASP